jgi:hypothetical protein
MAYSVQISNEAQIELDVAECFFRTKNLHKPFLEDFFRQIGFLETNALSFQVKYKGIRIINFESFNYSLHYVVKNGQVLILRILNQRQDF